MIDSREPLWVHQMQFDGAPTVVGQLDAGDVHVVTTAGDLLVIERKTPGDLLASIGDDRLLTQAARMAKLSRWCYIVITGELGRHASGKVVGEQGLTSWSWDAVQGALISAQELGAAVTWCGGAAPEDFRQAVLRLARRDRQTKRLAPVRPAEWTPAGEQILLALPGVGPDRAQALLDYAGTPAWALTYLTDQHTVSNGSRIPGVGPGVRRGVRTALGLPDGQFLCVLEDEPAPPSTE